MRHPLTMRSPASKMIRMKPEVATTMAAWLAQAKKAVFFTGAGISTESGIPDYRSPGGIWTKYRTVYYEEFLASAEARREYWRQKSIGHGDFAAAQPNTGHRLIAEWEAKGRIHGVITQNIDGLHQMAGSSNVLELHGTAREIECQDCGAIGTMPIRWWLNFWRPNAYLPAISALRAG